LLPNHALVLVVILSLMGSALATPLDIGTTVAVTNTVTLESGTIKQPLSKGTVVHQDEIIITGIGAKAEVELRDQTKLAVGPEARLVLDRFVYDPNASSASVSLKVSKGAFRFLTGLAPKDSYEIRTPAAFVGTRGTVFDLYVGGGGETAVLLLQGAVEVCTLARLCRIQNKIGSILVVGVDGVISQYSGCKSSFIQQIGFQTAFPFIGKRLVIDPIRRMLPADFECVPPRRPPIIRAQGESRSSSPAAGTAGLPSPGVLTWPGLYAGVDGGFGWSSAYLAAAFDPDSFAGRFDVAGGFAGVHVGYNWQRDRAVFGIEADFHGAGINGSKTFSEGGGPASQGAAFATAETSLNSFGTVRGRLGYALENTLFYATGGFAFGSVKDKLILVNPISGIPVNIATNNQTATGYAVGGGIEFYFERSWSAKLEYEYIDLGSDTLFTSLISGETATARFVHAYNTIHVGLSYHITADYEQLR
jgi:opacity protein-like surface antigen